MYLTPEEVADPQVRKRLLLHSFCIKEVNLHKGQRCKNCNTFSLAYTMQSKVGEFRIQPRPLSVSRDFHWSLKSCLVRDLKKIYINKIFCISWNGHVRRLLLQSRNCQTYLYTFKVLIQTPHISTHAAITAPLKAYQSDQSSRPALFYSAVPITFSITVRRYRKQLALMNGMVLACKTTVMLCQVTPLKCCAYSCNQGHNC